ncbi:hypothetical protein LB504_000966 [Fusarium proliferatum]|nr:hypothetical protein LB504_000966 [Fusarium proliferatum]
MASQIRQVNNLDLSAEEHDCQQGWSMWICAKTNPAPKSETIAKSHHRCHQQRTITTGTKNVNKEENIVDLPKAKSIPAIVSTPQPQNPPPSSINLRYDCIT